MGVLVHDNIEVPNIGIIISEFSITCRGAYEVSKEVVNDIATYHVRTLLHWIVAGGSQPIYTENFAFSLNIPPADVFTEIYDRVKSRYISTSDN